MEPDEEQQLLGGSLIAAAARHDLVAVKNLLRNGVSANVLDGETNITPLHAAVAGCAPPKGDATSEEPAASATGEDTPFKSEPVSAEIEDKAAEVIQVLFENGAIWNDLNAENETPGCIAWRLGLKKVYQMIVDAGVRAEVLLNRLAELEDDEAEEAGSDEDEELEDGANGDADLDSQEPRQEGKDAADEEASELPKPASAKATFTSTRVGGTAEPAADYIDHWDSNKEFLRSSLHYSSTQLLDSSSNAVMMDWETTLMNRHAELLLPRSGLRAMNIGHGMGIVDTAIQTHAPAEHHIVEAHPEVLARLRETGWYDKPGVHIHEGRWQDVLPRLVEKGIELDALYYDTFAEDYKDFRDLFSEHVIGLLDHDGRFGWYNGLGADRRVCYDVYTSVAEMDLLEAGFKTQWEELSVPEIEWKGVRRSYWNVDVYRLPTCTYL